MHGCAACAAPAGGARDGALLMTRWVTFAMRNPHSACCRLSPAYGSHWVEQTTVHVRGFRLICCRAEQGKEALPFQEVRRSKRRRVPGREQAKRERETACDGARMTPAKSQGEYERRYLGVAEEEPEATEAASVEAVRIFRTRGSKPVRDVKAIDALLGLAWRQGAGQESGDGDRSVWTAEDALRSVDLLAELALVPLLLPTSAAARALGTSQKGAFDDRARAREALQRIAAVSGACRDLRHRLQPWARRAMLAEAARCVRGAGESGTGEAGNQALAMAAGATLQALAAMNAFASLGEYEATVASAGVGSKSEDGGGDCPAAVVDGMVGWVADVLALARAATTATGPAWVNGCNEDSEALWRAVRGASGASWALAVACGAITLDHPGPSRVKAESQEALMRAMVAILRPVIPHLGHLVQFPAMSPRSQATLRHLLVSLQIYIKSGLASEVGAPPVDAGALARLQGRLQGQPPTVSRAQEAVFAGVRDAVGDCRAAVLEWPLRAGQRELREGLAASDTVRGIMSFDIAVIDLSRGGLVEMLVEVDGPIHRPLNDLGGAPLAGNALRALVAELAGVQLVTVQGSRTEMVEAAVKAVRARVLKVPSHGGT